MPAPVIAKRAAWPRGRTGSTRGASKFRPANLPPNPPGPTTPIAREISQSVSCFPPRTVPRADRGRPSPRQRPRLTRGWWDSRGGSGRLLPPRPAQKICSPGVGGYRRGGRGRAHAGLTPRGGERAGARDQRTRPARTSRLSAGWAAPRWCSSRRTHRTTTASTKQQTTTTSHHFPAAGPPRPWRSPLSSPQGARAPKLSGARGLNGPPEEPNRRGPPAKPVPPPVARRWGGAIRPG